jgi:hypothetical protein
MRDAKITQIYEGTYQILRVVTSAPAVMAPWREPRGSGLEVTDPKADGSATARMAVRAEAGMAVRAEACLAGAQDRAHAGQRLGAGQREQ